MFDDCDSVKSSLYLYLNERSRINPEPKSIQRSTHCFIIKRIRLLLFQLDASFLHFIFIFVYASNARRRGNAKTDVSIKIIVFLGLVPGRRFGGFSTDGWFICRRDTTTLDQSVCVCVRVDVSLVSPSCSKLTTIVSGVYDICTWLAQRGRS